MFKVDWKNHTMEDIIDNLEFIYATVIELNAQNILELGVRDGNSTRALIKAAEQTGGRVTSVENYFVSPMLREELMHNINWYLIEEDDMAVNFGTAKYDVIFIDTEHTYEQLTKELGKFVPMLNLNGVIMCHDTDQEGLKKAIDDYFADKKDYQILYRTESHGLGVIKWCI